MALLYAQSMSDWSYDHGHKNWMEQNLIKNTWKIL